MPINVDQRVCSRHHYIKSNLRGWLRAPYVQAPLGYRSDILAWICAPAHAQCLQHVPSTYPRMRNSIPRDDSVSAQCLISRAALPRHRTSEIHFRVPTGLVQQSFVQWLDLTSSQCFDDNREGPLSDSSSKQQAVPLVQVSMRYRVKNMERR